MLLARLIALISFVATSAIVADALAISQQTVNVQPFSDDPDPRCNCLTWKNAYETGAWCGDGMELNFLGIFGMNGTTAAQDPNFAYGWCYQYFNNLPNENFCQNTHYAMKPPQWCYVSKECPQAQLTPSKSAATKLCTKGKDKMLADMPFQALENYAKYFKLDLALMSQYAYPTWEPESIDDVQEWLGLGRSNKSLGPLSPLAQQRLQTVIDSGETMLFVSRDYKPPFAIVEGPFVFWINLDGPNGEYYRWDQRNVARCVKGCKEGTVKPWRIVKTKEDKRAEEEMIKKEFGHLGWR